MVDFGMYVKDVPESAQLSLTLVKIVDDKHEPVGYVNIRLFDWQSKYVRGKHSLNLWPFPPGVKSMLNLMGTLGPNHDMKAVRLEIEVLVSLEMLGQSSIVLGRGQHQRIGISPLAIARRVCGVHGDQFWTKETAHRAGANHGLHLHDEYLIFFVF